MEVVPVSIDNIGWKTYLYFAIFNLCFVPLIYFCKSTLTALFSLLLTYLLLVYPETQRLSLEQIDKLFTGEKVIMHWQSSMGDVDLEVPEGEELKTMKVDHLEGEASSSKNAF